jgi:predicted nucleic acid-binding protein
VKRRLVLDAWAILALIQGEELAASQVKSLLQDAQEGHSDLFISIINLGEVYYRIGRSTSKDQAQETLTEIRLLPLTVVSVTDDAVLAAAELKMSYALSYADAFAGALSEELGAALVTGDPEFRQLEGRIPLERLVRASR